MKDNNANDDLVNRLKALAGKQPYEEFIGPFERYYENGQLIE